MSKSELEEKVFHLPILDQTMVRGYVRLLFCFSFPDETKWSAATAQIKEGFIATLRRWPYLAGTIGPAVHAPGKPAGRMEIRYKDVFLGAGSALFTINRAWHSPYFSKYEDLCRAGMPPSALKGSALATLPDAADPRKFSPVCAIQANIIHGGLILSVYYHHSVMDGVAGRHFYHVLAENIRLAGKSGMAHLIPEQSEDPNANRLDLPHRALLPPSKLPTLPDYDFSGPPTTSTGPVIGRIFTFSSARIDALKDAILPRLRRDSLTDAPLWVSTFDCLAALIWTYVTRARAPRVSPSTHTKLAVAVNIRAKIAPPLPASYFGNAAMSAVARTTFAALADRDTDKDRDVLDAIAHGALSIRRAIAAVDDAYVRTRLALFASLADVSTPPTAILKALHQAGDPGTGLYLTSWADFGADADFGIVGTGSGCAEWVRKPRCGDEGGNIVLPRRGGMKGDEVWEVLVQVRVEEMERLVGGGELGGWAERVVE